MLMAICSGPFGADVEADRAENPALVRRPGEAEDLLGARARAEQADVRRVGLKKQAQPVAIVLEGVHLHDDQRARIDDERARSRRRASPRPGGGRRKPLDRSSRRADDRRPSPRIRRRPHTPRAASHRRRRRTRSVSVARPARRRTRRLRSRAGSSSRSGPPCGWRPRRGASDRDRDRRSQSSPRDRRSRAGRSMRPTSAGPDTIVETAKRVRSDRAERDEPCEAYRAPTARSRIGRRCRPIRCSRGRVPRPCGRPSRCHSAGAAARRSRSPVARSRERRLSRQPPLTPPSVRPSSSTRNLAPGLR